MGIIQQENNDSDVKNPMLTLSRDRAFFIPTIFLNVSLVRLKPRVSWIQFSSFNVTQSNRDDAITGNILLR